MLKVRKNVFETNSSSVHSICITKKSINQIEFPEKIVFKHGEFGRDDMILNTPEEKASYFYQAVCDLFTDKEKEKIINRIYSELGKYGIDAEFEPDMRDEFGLEYGGIDHSYNLREWCTPLSNNMKKLLRFIFSDESFVHTGSDECGTDVSINVNYKHEEFYKDS